MGERYTINLITPDTEDWTCKVQVVDKGRARDNKERSRKFQLLLLQDEEENQVQAIIFQTDIIHFEDLLVPFKTYLVSCAQVKESASASSSSDSPSIDFYWIIDRIIIIEPIEMVVPPEVPLPPPARLNLTIFDMFEYQPKEYDEFDVSAIVINGSAPAKTTTGKKIQEFILIDQQKKPMKFALWEDSIDHDGSKLLNRLHEFPVILARRVVKATIGATNRFNGLSSRYGTTIEINPPYPQAVALKAWAKAIEQDLVAYKAKSSTATASIQIVPFEEEIISLVNIQAQLPGQVFYVEGELSFANEDQRFATLACSHPKCKQLFPRYNVRREIYCPTCRKSSQLVPRCQFEVIVKDNTGSATATIADEVAEKLLSLTSEEIYELCCAKKEKHPLQHIQQQWTNKIFEIEMKKLFTKNVDTALKLSILSVLEKNVIHTTQPSATIDILEPRKRPLERGKADDKTVKKSNAQNLQVLDNKVGRSEIQEGVANTKQADGSHG